MERETGFEPATLALARRCSTTELFPLALPTKEAGFYRRHRALSRHTALSISTGSSVSRIFLLILTVTTMELPHSVTLNALPFGNTAK